MNIEKIKYIILIAFLSLNITDILSSNDNYNINDKVQVIKDDTIVFNNNIYIKHIPDNNDTNLTRYNKHLNTYTSFWSRLIPQYQKIQFYGSIGLVSVGTGWEYCNSKLETEILLGFIPKYNDTRGKCTFTLRENYIPFSLDFKNSRWSFNPLVTGFYINSIVDDRFWDKEPEKYPEKYYKFSTKVRFHLSLGQRFNFDLDNQKHIHKSVSLFYEVGTCDLYLISAISNKYLKPKDYLGLSFGVRFNLY